MNIRKPFYHCVAKTLILLMVAQSLPLWDLSHSHRWDPHKFWRNLQHIVSLLGPGEAHAAGSEVNTALVDVLPCFEISARAKSGKVQLIWEHQGAERYDIYRSAQSDPSNFQKIGDTTSTYATYLDETVQNEMTYLYVVAAVFVGSECYSNVISSHPTASRGSFNYPPIIYSLPLAQGTVDVVYSYDVSATDPNGDALTYSLVAAPAGMAIDAATGLIQWTPTAAQLGIHNVTVQVSDGRGGEATQSFAIEVSQAPNNAPEITSTPETTGTAGVLYTYDVDATDADGDPLTYSLITAPAGMAIDAATGLIQWTPTAAQLGIHNVTVQVSDGRGGEATQSFTIEVEAAAPVTDYIRPEVTVAVAPPVASAGDMVTITVNATDNVGVLSKELMVDGVVVPLGPSGTATYTSATPGIFTAVATAQDGAGNEGTDSEEFRFIVPGDVTPPFVAIIAPANEAKISEPVDIIGTASDENLSRYLLEYSAKGKNQFIPFMTGTSEVTNDVLGQLDPTMLRNGLYDVRLTAEDASGNMASITRTYQFEGEAKVGNFTISFNDLTIPMAGIPITITRTYDSRVKSKGEFGTGWTLDLKTMEVQENRVPGEGWETYCTQSIFNVCIGWGVRPTVDHTVLVTIPGIRDHEFSVQAVTTYADPSGLAQGSLAFSAQPGTFSTLQALGNANYDFLLGGELLDSSFEVIDPNLYRFTSEDGTIFRINQFTGLYQITDPNGNTIAFTSGGIIHSAGKSVIFTRDAQKRITSVTDPEGNTIQYEYDFYGDLVSVTDQEGNVTLFTYNSSHGLVKIVDPRGVTPARNEYDDEGRLIATIDADGNRIEFTHNIGARQEVVSDRLGNVTVYNYDGKGNVIAKTDALGNTTTYTYDGRGNKLSETDPLGNTTTFTYDARDNLLTETDPLGNTTSYTYNSRNQVLTETDPLGNLTTKTYDAKGNLLTETDPLGNTTTHTYDASGNRLTTADCLGNVTSYTYDPFGNKSSETDPLGNPTTYTYDDNGNRLTETTTRTTDTGVVPMTTAYAYNSLGQLIQTVDPDGNVTTTEYNSIRKRSAQTDKLGNSITYEYDGRGNLVRTTYPDGGEEASTYDANGNRISSTDKAGRTTTYQYDALNRLIRTTFPDGNSASNEYDAAGRLIATIDENGNRTEYLYDAAGRRTGVTDALGTVTISAYDGNGNQIGMADANGNTTQYEYDGLGRRIRTIFADGTFRQDTYAGCGTQRKIAETDQAGNTTQFAYDALGRLIGVTDALGNVTAYSYDEVGNRISQTDSNGNTTLWSYDNFNRLVKRTLPLGMFETFTYDANGNKLSHTDFKGDTTLFTYDVNNRLVNKTYPDSSEVSFAYAITGQPVTVTDSRGVTSHTYDLRDRLVEVENPDGTTISYTYDAVGNRTSVTVPSGITTFTYDGLKRLASASDPDGGVTTYTYDAVGNRISVVYPNGAVTQYTYDSLNRLLNLTNRKSDSTLISSYAYTLGPAGNRVRVVENTGREVDYTYDAIYRLVEEDITDPVLGNETISYTYDPVGNRLSKTDASGTTNYTYDANNRLLAEDGTTYTYDANGNTLSKTVGSDTTDFAYDYENRLLSVVTPTSVIAYTYDFDGIRVSSTVDIEVTSYLVDKSRDYAQVLEERDSIGALLVSYVYGDDLISQKRGVQTSYYLYDGMASTRQLIDETQTVTDTYVFDAFGIELDRIGTTENNYLYTGEQYDPNVGFYYLRARYYDVQTGRFITEDPAPGNPYDPVSLHKYLYGNANPVMFIDPSGETSIMSVMVSIAIVGILSSVAYASAFHLISITRTPVTWEGVLMYGGGGGAGWGVLGFVAILESQCHSGQKSKGIYFMAAAGGVLAPPWLPISEGVALINLITPGIFGPKPWTLVGPFSWLSATASWGVGPSWTAMYMGMGIGEIGLIPGAAFGIDIGLDALGGVSIPLYLGPVTSC